MSTMKAFTALMHRACSQGLGSANALHAVRGYATVSTVKQPKFPHGEPDRSSSPNPSPAKVVPGWSEDGSLLCVQRAGGVGDSFWKQPLLVHPTWLRDHCRCPVCYDSATYNKLVDVGKIGLDIRPKTTEVRDDRLLVTWPDGHESVYDLDWLRRNVNQKPTRVDRTLWSRSLTSMDMEESMVEYRDYAATDKVVKKVLKSVVRNGFAVIKNAPRNTDGLLQSAKRISPPRYTGFFDGPVLEFQTHMLHSKHDSQDDEHHRLHPHADQTYLTEPAGLKMVLCSESDAATTINLVDGYQVAEQLRHENPTAYGILSSVPITYEYLDDQFHHITHDVILKHDTLSGDLLQFRYNMHYRSALTTVPFTETDRFFSALRHLTRLVRSGQNQVRLQMAAGYVLVLDNWRVLSCFSNTSSNTTCSSTTTPTDQPGVRFHGCYLGRSDYMNRARRFNLVDLNN